MECIFVFVQVGHIICLEFIFAFVPVGHIICLIQECTFVKFQVGGKK